MRIAKQKQKTEIIEPILIVLSLFIAVIFSMNNPTGLMIMGNWISLSDLGYMNEDALISNTNDSYLTYSFNGTKLFIITQERDDFGIMDVEIGGVHYSYDLYSEQTSYKIVKEMTLEEGEHNVTIYVSGNKNANSFGTYILVDEITTVNPINATQEELQQTLTQQEKNITLQLPAEINKPVEWKQNVVVENGELNLEVPSTENLTVKKKLERDLLKLQIQKFW